MKFKTAYYILFRNWWRWSFEVKGTSRCVGASGVGGTSRCGGASGVDGSRRGRTWRCGGAGRLRLKTHGEPKSKSKGKLKQSKLKQSKLKQNKTNHKAKPTTKRNQTKSKPRQSEVKCRQADEVSRRKRMDQDEGAKVIAAF